MNDRFRKYKCSECGAYREVYTYHDKEIMPYCNRCRKETVHMPLEETADART